MMRRRADESDARAAEREACCSQRAFAKVADCADTQPIVRAWFQQAVMAVEARCPAVFREASHTVWSECIQREALDRRAAEAAAESATEKHADAAPKKKVTFQMPVVAQHSIHAAATPVALTDKPAPVQPPASPKSFAD